MKGEFAIANNKNPKWGQIWYADLGEPNGHTQGGIRPVMITSNNMGNTHSPQIEYISMTSKTKSNLPIHAHIKKGDINGLKTDTTALTEQTGTLDKIKLIKPIGEFEEINIIEIAKAFVLQHPFVIYALKDKNFMESEILARLSC